jgi:hypothetical protein
VFVWGNYFTITPTACVDYQQNRVDSKDTMIKTSVCVRTALLKRVFFRSKESSLPFKSYIGGYYSCVYKTFRSVCSLFSVLNYLSSSTYIRTYINHNNRYECTNLESLLRYNVNKNNNYINKYTLYILNEDMNGWRGDRYKNLNLAYKLTLSNTSKINKIYKYIVHHNGHWVLSNYKDWCHVSAFSHDHVQFWKTANRPIDWIWIFFYKCLHV